MGAPTEQNIITISEFEVFMSLSQLKKTAPGPDDIPYWVFKECAYELSGIITHIFNSSLKSGVVPEAWKKAYITPIPKVRKASEYRDFADLRLISVTPILFRLVEKIVVRRYLWPLMDDEQIFRSFLKFKLFRSRNLPPPESFELMATKLSTGNKETIFLNIYRPPSSKMSTFLDEFQNLLEIFVPSPSELIISGDFNIHADSDLSTPNKFSGILDNFHLTQHINFPTHDDGHTLDLLITRSSSTVVTHLSHHESYQSDHKSFTFKFFPHIRPTTQRSTIQYRSYNTTDVENFKSDILTSPLYTNSASNASDLADQFSSTLKSILDIHAPIRSKTVVQRPHTPWINPEILQAKRERSRLERCWRRWKSPCDRMKFRAQCNSVRSLISKAKSSFLSNLVTESSDNPRTLWKTLNTILHRKPSNSLPESPDASSLANTFLDFFKDKIERIRTKFVPSDSPDPFLSPPAPPPKMTNFIPATLTEIHKLISASESKQCPLDSIPTFLLKLCFNELGPIITNLVNLSLYEGIFPSSFKQALV